MIKFQENGQGFFDFEALDKLSEDDLKVLYEEAVSQEKKARLDYWNELKENGATAKYHMLLAAYRFWRYQVDVLFDYYANRLVKGVNNE